MRRSRSGESLENLPVGLDGARYQWTDLHGEGIPGILTEQAGAWFYKRNLSPITAQANAGRPRAAEGDSSRPLETVAAQAQCRRSSAARAVHGPGRRRPARPGRALDGPTPGFYEHDDDEGWEPFRAFTSRLNRDWDDPNLQFVDLDGDGHADVLITEDDAFVWHPSLAEEGFGPARRVAPGARRGEGPAPRLRRRHAVDLPRRPVAATA